MIWFLPEYFYFYVDGAHRYIAIGPFTCYLHLLSGLPRIVFPAALRL